MLVATPIPVAELVAALHRLGVQRGDALMVHASLRKLGPVDGGATGVLDALDAAVGPEGTLAPYDPLSSPVLPEVGFLAEAFRTRPGTIVTDNPSGRFAARGALAKELLRDAPWDDYYGPGSPLHRLCAAGGRVLRLGANPDTTTVLHYAEYLAELPGKRRVRRHYRILGAHGPETRSVECLDDEHGIVDWPGKDAGDVLWPDNDYFAVILKAYLSANRGWRGRVGNADAQLIEAAEIVDFGARWMAENLRARRS
jgi:aminoglycoside N3'-acetyltransferase